MEKRTKKLEKQAYDVARNRNMDAIHDIERVIRAIMQAVQR